MTDTATVFRTPEGQARYFAAYDSTLALWPVPVEAVDVLTSFGRTHLNVCGPKDAPPLVLVPGQAISSTMWYPNIAALSAAHRVYALDILGDMGKSVRTRPFASPLDFAAWLLEVFNALQIEHAHIAGLSYGGFIALRLALSAPERVSKLVLMAPASLLPIRRRFFLRMLGMLLPPFILSARAKQKLLLGVDTPAMAPAIRQMLTTTDFQYNMYLPPVYTDAELRSVRPPTLLLLGDKELIYDYAAASQRANAFIPNIQTIILPNAGHALNFDQPEIVNQHILEFLKTDAE